MKRLAKYIPKDMQTGKILGKVILVDCIKCDENFKEMCLKENKDVYAKSTFVEKYAWQLDNIEVFDNPIDSNCKLSLWYYEI